jgi:hypothetical protein
MEGIIWMLLLFVFAAMAIAIVVAAGLLLIITIAGLILVIGIGIILFRIIRQSNQDKSA